MLIFASCMDGEFTVAHELRSENSNVTEVNVYELN
jgi:hypothetical protein